MMKNIKMEFFLAALWVLITLSQRVHASADTLPQNIWRVSLRSDTRTFSTIGGETFDGAGNPNGDFTAIKVTEYAAKNIESFQPLIANNLISGDLKLLDSGSETNYFLDIAYGLTDSLSIGISIPYRNRTVTYSQAYIDAFQALNDEASAGLIPGVTSADIIVPPKVAKGEGIGDITAGFRYKVFNGFSLQATAKAGFLKTGKDYTEIAKKTDGFEEIVTGISGDEYTLEGYYDLKLNPLILEFSGIYTIYTAGHASGLDNDFDTQKGNTLQLNGNAVFPLIQSVTMGVGGYGFWGDKSKIKDSQGNWSNIPNSDVSALVAQIQFNYTPFKYMQIWLGAERPLYNKAVGGLYDYPGRLSTDLMINLGTHLYF